MGKEDTLSGTVHIVPALKQGANLEFLCRTTVDVVREGVLERKRAVYVTVSAARDAMHMTYKPSWRVNLAEFSEGEWGHNADGTIWYGKDGHLSEPSDNYVKVTAVRRPLRARVL
jgi:hypothetical protein